MKNLSTFEKGIVIGLIFGIGISLLFLGLMSEHGPLRRRDPLSEYPKIKITQSENENKEQGREYENGKNEEDGEHKEIYFDPKDLVVLTGIILSIGFFAFGTAFLIKTLRKRNLLERAKESEQEKLTKRLELIEEALLDKRISEETYRELRAKYEEMLNDLL